MKSAIVLGATGLVGREIVDLLEGDAGVERVVLLVRRQPDRPTAAKTEVRIVDFRAPRSFGDLAADALFSALGTTRKTAGSKEAQYEVDHTFQLEVARAARNGGVGTLALCSSLGATPDSRMFYTRMKGELERDVIALGFDRTRIVRPSVLVGDRGEKARPGEAIGGAVMGVLGVLPGLTNYRPVTVRAVAAKVIAAAKDPAPGVQIIESRDIA